jgi:hypothetical protein
VRAGAAAVLLASVLAGLLAGVAAAVTPPAGTPDLSMMTVQSTDLQPGATIGTDGYQKASSPFTAAYVRSFNGAQLTPNGVPFGLTTILMIAPTSAVAQQAFIIQRHVLGSSGGRHLIAMALLGNRSKQIPSNRVHVGKITSLRVGDGAFEVPVTVRVPPIVVTAEWAVIRTGRVLATIVPVAVGSKLPGSITATLGGDVSGHIASVLAGATGPTGTSGPTGATGTTGAAAAA